MSRSTLKSLRMVLTLLLVAICTYPIKAATLFNSSSEDVSFTTIRLNTRTPLSRQFVSENTIYIVSSTIDLEGETIIIPSNCKLKIKRGIISNGCLTGNNTSIESIDKFVFRNVKFAGTWKNIDVHPEWFGAKGNGKIDDAEAIQQAAYLAANNRMSFKSGKKYLCRKGVRIKDNTDIYGGGATIIKACYSAIFCNEHYNEDVVDHDINLYGLKGITLNNNYRGLWVWFVGVNNCQIKDCSFTNQTPINIEQEPQWCMTLSGEDIEIANCVIDTKGGGLFSDGIHFYNALNCNIHHCVIQTDDDCLGFCPEISDNQRGFKKFDYRSANINIHDNVLASGTNCVRFEVRENAPTGFVYNDVSIHDIVLGEDGTKVGSFLYIHDYRNNSGSKNSNFKIWNIQCNGNFYGGKRNFIEVFGKNPETLPKGICNIENVQVIGIKANLNEFENFIRIIGTESFAISNCFFEVGDDYRTGISLRDVSNVSVTDCFFTTNTPYSFLDIVSSSGIIRNNTISRVSANNNAGTAIAVDHLSGNMFIEKNKLTNFAIGLWDKRKNRIMDTNVYEKCNLKIKVSDTL